MKGDAITNAVLSGFTAVAGAGLAIATGPVGMAVGGAMMSAGISGTSNAL